METPPASTGASSAATTPHTQRDAYARAAVITSREMAAGARAATQHASTAARMGVGRAAILRPLGAEVQKARRLFDDVRNISERVLAIGDTLTEIEREATRLEIAKRRRAMLADVCSAVQAAKSVQKAHQQTAVAPAAANAPAPAPVNAPVPATESTEANRPAESNSAEKAATAASETEADEKPSTENETTEDAVDANDEAAAPAAPAAEDDEDNAGAETPAADDDTDQTSEDSRAA
uniref:Uncharacterized protein n=1 Tax=Neobodo designis TaxID=312471 RepID=A0A7S1PVW2_NEODS